MAPEFFGRLVQFCQTLAHSEIGKEIAYVSDVSICVVTQDNWRAALQLGVPPEQLHLVAGMAPIVALALAKAYIRPWNKEWVPYVFSADGAMIGFAELAYEPGSIANYWLFHFFIDQHYQGHGYGKQALLVFLQTIREQHPTCETFQLTVHPENQRAQHLYETVGFRPTGTELGGEPLYHLKMHAEVAE